MGRPCPSVLTTGIKEFFLAEVKAALKINKAAKSPSERTEAGSSPASAQGRFAQVRRGAEEPRALA
jgi:hypothetical protein